jgi:hypothetical protein
MVLFAYSADRLTWLAFGTTDQPQRTYLMTQSNPQPDRIDVDDAASLARWTRELDTTEEQLKDAVAQVGDKAADIEMHLKGARSTTNADRVQQAGSK